MRKWLCKIGLHKWNPIVETGKSHEGNNILTMFIPISYYGVRTCQRCSLEQRMKKYARDAKWHRR